MGNFPVQGGGGGFSKCKNKLQDEQWKFGVEFVSFIYKKKSSDSLENSKILNYYLNCLSLVPWIRPELSPIIMLELFSHSL